MVIPISWVAEEKDERGPDVWAQEFEAANRFAGFGCDYDKEKEWGHHTRTRDSTLARWRN